MAYRVFVRNWWRRDASGARQPDPTARKTTIARPVDSEADAQAIAREYNRTHTPGPLSRKAEYEEIR